MCGQSTAYNTYATLPDTNPLFMGFSHSQNVLKEIINLFQRDYESLQTLRFARAFCDWNNRTVIQRRGRIFPKFAL